jgi:sulfatase maturation enzyme AslB (radical SAM superfamily)
MSLHPHFRDRTAFAPTSSYRLLPFRFGKLDDGRYVLTNDVGEYVVAGRADLVAFVRCELAATSALYKDLKSRHFLFDDQSRVALDLLALKYRTRAAPIAELTSLHMFVVTLRCDHSCHYCQVSRQTEDRTEYDMKPAHADQALTFAFSAPSRSIKIEFQGGEPLLNFGLIRHVVERG